MKSPWSGTTADTGAALITGISIGATLENGMRRTIFGSSVSPLAAEEKSKADNSPKLKDNSVTEFSSKDYVDAKIGEANAVQRADFAEVVAKIEILRAEMKSVSDRAIKRSDLYVGLAAAVGVIVAVVIGIATVGADRFSAGMSVQPVIEKTIQDQNAAFKEIFSAQVARDVSQDDQLKDISEKIDALLKGVSIGQQGTRPD